MHETGATMAEPVDPRAVDPLHHAGTPTPCRWCSAGTSVVWVTSDANAKPMPIEAGVNEDGNVEIVFKPDGQGVPRARAVVHATPPGMLADFVPYMPHHATCTRNLKGS